MACALLGFAMVVQVRAQARTAEYERRIGNLEGIQAERRLTAIETRLVSILDELKDTKSLNQGVLAACVVQLLLSGYLGLRRERSDDRKSRSER